MIRKTIFWAHLMAGLVAGLVLASIALTGAVLTYERQMVRAAEFSSLADRQDDSAVLSADALLTQAKRHWPEAALDQLVLEATRHRPVKVYAGRTLLGLISPYDATVLVDEGATTRQFMRDTRSLHRWLLQSGDARPTGRLIVSIATIAFALMIVTGVYLWLPKTFSHKSMAPRIWFKAPTKTTTARHFMWHHSFSFWTWPLLLVLALSGLVFSSNSYRDWVSDYGAPFVDPATEPLLPSTLTTPPRLFVPSGGPLELALAQASAYVPESKRFHLYLPRKAGDALRVRADAGTGAEAAKRTDMLFDAGTGTLLQVSPYSTTAPGRRALIFVRFLHTGEVYGLLGQTVAGLVTIAMLFLIYSGMLLGINRLRAMVQR